MTGGKITLTAIHFIIIHTPRGASRDGRLPFFSVQISAYILHSINIMYLFDFNQKKNLNVENVDVPM